MTQTIEQVPAAAWRSWTEANEATVIDVREPIEWTLGILPEAELIPLGDLPHRATELDPNRPVLMVCRSGNRSNVAASMLARAGFRTANMAGGMVALGLA
jgi:rhodanese-related sulfurtransferase